MSERQTCQICGESDLQVYLDLGITPLADRLVEADKLGEQELTFPLQVAFCPHCSLSQLLKMVPADILFGDKYPYYSSFLPALLAHSKKNVTELMANRKLGPDSLVVEIASNDGYLLRNYVEQGIPVLGIDPADGPAAAAEKVGVRTMNTFFTEELAEKLVNEGQQADILHANNVLAHVPDQNGLAAGIGKLLKPGGVAVIEVPYMKHLIENCEFDTIYHEHLCYFTITCLDALFRRHGLYLNNVRELDIHGGSIRLFVEHEENVSDSVKELLRTEKAEGLDTFAFYENFGTRVEALKRALMDMLVGIRHEGKTIAAYGAAAKGATMINYCGISTKLVDFVVDRNIHKHGKHMPGQHIPILPPEALVEKKPDFVLILAWNFADEIMEQQKAYRELGGQFIIPIPVPRLA